MDRLEPLLLLLPSQPRRRGNPSSRQNIKSLETRTRARRRRADMDLRARHGASWISLGDAASLGVRVLIGRLWGLVAVVVTVVVVGMVEVVVVVVVVV